MENIENTEKQCNNDSSKQDFSMDQIFDAWWTQAIMSPKGKQTIQKINTLLDDVA
jgi:uncharacterized protein YqcC (DUF446 family)